MVNNEVIGMASADGMLGSTEGMTGHCRGGLGAAPGPGPLILPLRLR